MTIDSLFAKILSQEETTELKPWQERLDIARRSGDSTRSVRCSVQDYCGGCEDLGLPLFEQKQKKILQLQSLLSSQKVLTPTIDFLSPGDQGLRDRLDFTLEEGRLGLRHKVKTSILDLPQCPQLSPALHEWYEAFRKNLPPVRKGSVRLRVSPSGDRGLWLDLANLDIKTLLDVGQWLHSLDPQIAIEMGQRRKSLHRPPGQRPTLEDPLYRPWFQSSWRDQKVPLYGLIGGFTQPSLHANRLITDWVQRQIESISPTRITEFGAGQGNLSFPALSGEAHLTACEFDRGSVLGFEESLQQFAKTHRDLRPRVRIEIGDFLRKPSDSLVNADLLIANPPRSGLKAFLNPLNEAKALRAIMYMSCHPESFSEDAARIQAQGFHLSELQILDQFPQTKHYEVLSVWRR